MFKRSRESVSPVCGIFLIKICRLNYKKIDWNTDCDRTFENILKTNIFMHEQVGMLGVILFLLLSEA